MSKNKTNIHFILEIFWLIIAILTFVMALHAWFVSGLKSAGMFFLMSLLCILLFLARRAIRKKLNKN